MSMIINVYSKQKIHLFVNKAEFYFFYKLLFGVSLGGAITHMLPGRDEREMFEDMFKRFEHAKGDIETKQINL